MKLTKLLLILFILSLPLGQLGRLPFGGEGINLYVYDILVPAILFVWIVYSFGIRKKVFTPPLSGFIIAFAAISLLSLLNALQWLNPDEFIVSGSYWIRWVMYTGLYFAVYDLVKGDKGSEGSHPELDSGSFISGISRFRNHSASPIAGKFGMTNRELLTNLLILSGVILTILGFLQLIIAPDFKQLAETSGWDPHKNRLASTFLDPNFCGVYLVLTLNLILSKVLATSSAKSRGVLRLTPPRCYLFALITTAVALLLTFSRSAWLMFAASISVIGILKSRKLLIAAFIIAFCAYYFVPRVQTRIANITDPADSASKRFVSWQQTWDIAKENPIAGVGFNAFRYAQREAGYFEAGEFGGRAGAGSDSSLLLVLATTGVFGFTVYLLLYGKIALDTLITAIRPERAAARHWRAKSEGRVSDPQLQILSLALLASLAGLLIESNFINSLFYPQIMAWIWIMAALSQGQEAKSKGK